MARPVAKTVFGEPRSREFFINEAALCVLTNIFSNAGDHLCVRPNWYQQNPAGHNT